MKKCSKCDFENSDNAKFCQDCGAKLELKACTNEECRDYGKYILPQEAKFCPRCGQMIKGQESSEEKKNTNKTSSMKEESDGYINGHEYVDLGLPSGLKWATCNVGANKPEDYGNYYAWGETSTKSSYTKRNSKTFGKEMNNIKGDSQYDAARANWGSTWRMPTESELEELKNECTWKRTTQNGAKGYRVIGPNGNSIFLPAAGYRYGSSLFYAGEGGYYWSSTPDGSNSYFAYVLYFGNGLEDVLNFDRGYGPSVRPVSE